MLGLFGRKKDAELEGALPILHLCFILSASVRWSEQAHLTGFFFKLRQIAKDLGIVVPDTVGFAGIVEQFHQFPVSGTEHFIGIAIGANIAILQSGELSVQLGIEIFPIPAAQRHTHAEIQNALDPGFDAGIQNAAEVLRRVVQKGQNGTQPHHRGDAGFLKFPQHGDPLGGGGHIGFNQPAKTLVEGGQGDLHHRLGAAVDAFQ